MTMGSEVTLADMGMILVVLELGLLRVKREDSPLVVAVEGEGEGEEGETMMNGEHLTDSMHDYITHQHGVFIDC